MGKRQRQQRKRAASTICLDPIAAQTFWDNALENFFEAVGDPGGCFSCGEYGHCSTRCPHEEEEESEGEEWSRAAGELGSGWPFILPCWEEVVAAQARQSKTPHKRDRSCRRSVGEPEEEEQKQNWWCLDCGEGDHPTPRCSFRESEGAEPLPTHEPEEAELLPACKSEEVEPLPARKTEEAELQYYQQGAQRRRPPPALPQLSEEPAATPDLPPLLEEPAAPPEGDELLFPPPPPEGDELLFPLPPSEELEQALPPVANREEELWPLPPWPEVPGLLATPEVAVLFAAPPEVVVLSAGPPEVPVLLSAAPPEVAVLSAAPPEVAVLFAAPPEVAVLRGGGAVASPRARGGGVVASPRTIAGREGMGGAEATPPRNFLGGAGV
ncbi:UNVERIFIED_CONTAM: hypothetical protein FKN15_006355 [Acipenser sinensis]